MSLTVSEYEVSLLSWESSFDRTHGLRVVCLDGIGRR